MAAKGRGKNGYSRPDHYSICDWHGFIPHDIVSEVVRDYTARGDTVFDPFSGRGTVLMESALQARRAVGTEISHFAAVASSLILDPTVVIEKVERAILAVEMATEKTRTYLFSTICPHCDGESQVMAYLYRNGEAVEAKHSCQACKSAGMHDLGEFDRAKSEEILKMSIPVPDLPLPENVAAMFTRRNLMALRVLKQLVMRQEFLVYRPIMTVALAQTAALCADLEGRVAAGADFLFLNPFDFMKIHIRKIVAGIKSARRLLKGKVPSTSIINESAFAHARIGGGNYSTVITVPPLPGQSLGSGFALVAESFMNIDAPGLARKDILAFPSPGKAQETNDFLKRSSWLLAELAAKGRHGCRVCLLLDLTSDGERIGDLYRKAIANSGLRVVDTRRWEVRDSGSHDSISGATPPGDKTIELLVAALEGKAPEK